MRATWCIALTIVALGCRSDPTSDLLPLPDARPYTVDRFPDAHRAVVYFDGGASGDGTTASTDAAGKDDAEGDYEPEDDFGFAEIPPCVDPGCNARQEALVGAITLRETRGSAGADEAEVVLFEFRNGLLDAPAAPIADDDGGGCLLYNAECTGCGADGASLSPGEVTVFGGAGTVTLHAIDGGGATLEPAGVTDLWSPGHDGVQVAAEGDSFGSFAVTMVAPEEFVFIFTDESPFSRDDGLLTWLLGETTDPDAMVEIELHPRNSELRAVCSAPAEEAELEVSETAFAWLAGEGETITLTYTWRTRKLADASPEGQVQVILEREAIVHDVVLTD